MKPGAGFRALGVLALVVSAVVPAPGQVTGRVIGTVVDATTGEPLVGGLVIIQETNLGNITSEDGSYFINDVPVGRHRITSEYLGYTAVTEARRIVAGETVNVDFRMATDMIAAETISAVIAREPWRPPPPTRIYTQRFPPTDIPEPTLYECSAHAALHGAFIEEGRWELQASVKQLTCRRPPPSPPASEETEIVRITTEEPGEAQR